MPPSQPLLHEPSHEPSPLSSHELSQALVHEESSGIALNVPLAL